MEESYVVPPGYPAHRDYRAPQPTQLQRRRAFPAWLIQYANWLIYRAAQEHAVPVYEVCMGGRKRTPEVVAAREQVMAALVGTVVQSWKGNDFRATTMAEVPFVVTLIGEPDPFEWRPISRPAISALIGKLDQSSVTKALKRVRVNGHA